MGGVQADHIEQGYCPRIPGERLPASYINHYIANGGVVIPQFGAGAKETDKKALEVLQKAYPDRKVQPSCSALCAAVGPCIH